jgi:hypothetical protein
MITTIASSSANEQRLPQGTGFALVFVLAFVFWYTVLCWAVL